MLVEKSTSLFVHATVDEDIGELPNQPYPGRVLRTHAVSEGKGFDLPQLLESAAPPPSSNRRAAFRDGLSPEAIARECFPTMTLEQIYGAITFYLANRAELDAHLQTWKTKGAAWRQADFDMVRSPEFGQFLRAHNFTLVSWRDLNQVIRRSQ